MSAEDHDTPMVDNAATHGNDGAGAETGTVIKQKTRAFLLFADERYESIQQKHPDLTGKAFDTKLWEAWEALPADERSKYCSRSEEMNKVANQNTGSMPGSLGNVLRLCSMTEIEEVHNHLTGTSQLHSYAKDKNKKGPTLLPIEGEVGDTHCCGKCKLIFHSLEDYVKHKLAKDNCKVIYQRGQHKILIPKIKVKEEVGVTPEQRDTTDSTLQGEKTKDDLRRAKRKRKLGIEPDAIITEKKRYQCSQCDRSFNREATLKRHQQYDHETTKGSEDDDDNDDEGEIVQFPEDKEWKKENLDYGKYEPVMHARDYEGPDDSDGLGERPFLCELCQKRFKEASVLKAHMVTHSEHRDYICPWETCSYAFKTKGSLKRHMRRHTGERPYRCDLCNRSFSESGALTRHLKSRTSCTEKSDADLPRYGSKVDLGHPAYKGPAPDGSMQPVQAVTEAGSGPDQHEGQHEGQEEPPDDHAGELDLEPVAEAVEEVNLDPNQCRACLAVLENTDTLKAHLNLHLSELPFRCGLCTFLCSSKDKLDSHMQEIHKAQLPDSHLEKAVGGGDATATSLIQAANEREIGLTSTVLLQHPDGTVQTLVTEQHSGAQGDKTPGEEGVENENAETEVSPEEAEKRTLAAIALKQFLDLKDQGADEANKDTEVHLFQCPICKRNFRGSSYLRLHLRCHTGERPHKCDLCEKKFTTRDALMKHLTSHSDERQYKCGECGKMFKRISHVREHLKIHTNERPFPCSICDKAFKTANACKVHMRTHTCFMPYGCKYCHRHFREKGSLDRHLRTHTGERPYKCKYCGKAFAEHGTLNRHLKAKVPCTKQVMVEGDEVQDDSIKKYPTLLTEFSKVVTDAQQYIITDAEQKSLIVTLQEGVEGAQGAENIQIMATEDSTIQNVESQQQYIVLGRDNDKLTLFNQDSGEILTVSAAQGLEGLMDLATVGSAQMVTMIPEQAGEVEAVAMETGDAVQVEQQEVIDASVQQAVADAVETAIAQPEQSTAAAAPVENAAGSSVSDIQTISVDDLTQNNGEMMVTVQEITVPSQQQYAQVTETLGEVPLVDELQSTSQTQTLQAPPGGNTRMVVITTEEVQEVDGVLMDVDELGDESKPHVALQMETETMAQEQIS